MEQLLRNAQESGGDEVPATIQSLVLSRMDRLSPADKAALQAVSVIGQRFSLEILRHLIDDAAYRPDGLIAHYLVRPEGEDLLFGHALIQESIYGSLLKTRQRSLHLRAAAWFAERDAALNAGHLDRAQDPAAAAAYLQAARQTARDFRFARAEKLAARGLELATESAERSALTCLRGELLHDLGDAEASIEAFREGLELAEDDAERCRARIGMAAGMRIVDRLDEAFAALDAAEREAGSADLPDELARLHHLRGNLFFPLGNITGCREAHEQALDYAQRASSTDLEARALSGLGDAEYNRGRMITANGYFRRCVELAQRHGHRRIEVANRSMVGFSRYYANEIREAYADGAAAAESASEVGHLRAELLGRLMMYWTLYDLADFDRAKEEIGNARRLAERLGSGRFLAQTHTTLASILRREGQREEALETAERAVAISLDSGAGFNGPWAMSELALNTEDDEERQRHLDEGAALLRSGAVAHNHVFFYRNAMDACLESEDWSGVERYGQTLWDFTRQEPLPICDFFIVRGRVRVVNYSYSGREVSYDDLSAGAVFGELSAIDGAPRSASVVADKESLLAAMSASLFTRLVVSEPEMVQHLLLRLAGIIRSCDERIMDLSTLGAVQRVYLELMRLAEESRSDDETGDDWRISPLPTHKAIASLASTTRETVARSMSQLVSGGIIERKGKTIVIRDFDRLERLAGALEVEWPGSLSR